MKDDSFRDFVLDQLSGLDGIDSRAMFGGHGLYRHGIFFGIIYKGRLFFKVDDRSRPAYLERKMKPFWPKPQNKMPTYYEVPVEILENREDLAAWAATAASVETPEKPAKRRR